MLRFLDIVFAVLALLALAPLLLPIMVILRFTGEGEVFYRQERIGKGGKPFAVLKFVTMVKGSSKLGTGTVTLKNDPRVLPVGRYLRKTKINELPQLFNILKGEMSVVGPRPQTRRCFDAFTPAVRERLVEVRPGLSGLGAIVFRDEEEILGEAADPVRCYDEVIAPYKGAVEQWYVDRQTLRNYLLVIFVTVWVLIFPRSTIVWRAFDLPPPPPELGLRLSAAAAR